MLWTVLGWVLYVGYVWIAGMVLAGVAVRLRRVGRPLTIGVFHPYCNAGGGGERVLFAVLQSLSQLRPHAQILLYTGDLEPSSAILSKAKAYFDIDLESTSIELVRLRLRKWTEASQYPAFTLLGQFCGSALLVMEAVLKRPPSVFIDTHGHAFGYWFARLVCGVRVVAYVHYPAMSSDMIQRVREMRPSYNNSARITRSVTVSYGKLLYYHVLYSAYSLMGRFVALAICNSTWTRRHIQAMWKAESVVVYPPCNIVRFAELPLERHTEEVAVSVGQFRPEKDHELQIDAFAVMLQQHPELSAAKLQLIGSCRGTEDEERVRALRQRAATKGVAHAIEFHLNVSFDQLLRLLSKAQVGVHSMWNEHFGICVVELMAAGLVTVAHASGGPKEDIVKPGESGFLATTAQEYADCMARGFQHFLQLQALRKTARSEVAKYSDQSFFREFSAAVARFL